MKKMTTKEMMIRSKQNEARKIIDSYVEKFKDYDFENASELSAILCPVRIMKTLDGSISILVENKILNPKKEDLSVDEFLAKYVK